MSEHIVKPIKSKPRANTIIVVEPDVLTRMVLADYLRECGYKVVECPNAEDVLIILSAGRKVDAVLCEVDLIGGLNGFGLALRVKETHPAVDVLLTSGPSAAADRAGQLCEDGPLEQPYHPRDVVRRLDRLRERRRRRAEA
jgi:DNA-binding response OmpR family regulator